MTWNDFKFKIAESVEHIKVDNSIKDPAEKVVARLKKHLDDVSKQFEKATDEWIAIQSKLTSSMERVHKHEKNLEVAKHQLGRSAFNAQGHLNHLVGFQQSHHRDLADICREFTRHVQDDMLRLSQTKICDLLQEFTRATQAILHDKAHEPTSQAYKEAQINGTAAQAVLSDIYQRTDGLNLSKADIVRKMVSPKSICSGWHSFDSINRLSN